MGRLSRAGVGADVAGSHLLLPAHHAPRVEFWLSTAPPVLPDEKVSS
jgi:hypothetical protein